MRIRRISGHAAPIPRRPPGSRAPADLRCEAARARRWAGRMTTTTRGVSPCRSGRAEAISSPTPDCCIPKNMRKLRGRARRSNWNDCGCVADARASAGDTAPPSFQSTGDRRCRRLLLRLAMQQPAAGQVPSPARPTQSSGPTPPGRPLCMAQGEPFSWRAANQNSACFRPEHARLVGAPVTTRGAAFGVRAEMGVWSWAPTMSRTVPLRRRTKW